MYQCVCVLVPVFEFVSLCVYNVHGGGIRDQDGQFIFSLCIYIYVCVCLCVCVSMMCLCVCLFSCVCVDDCWEAGAAQLGSLGHKNYLPKVSVFV